MAGGRLRGQAGVWALVWALILLGVIVAAVGTAWPALVAGRAAVTREQTDLAERDAVLYLAWQFALAGPWTLSPGAGPLVSTYPGAAATEQEPTAGGGTAAFPYPGAPASVSAWAVLSDPPVAVRMTPTSASVPLNGQIALAFVALDAAGNIVAVPGATAQWSVQGTGSASVTPQGVLTGTGTGTVTVCPTAIVPPSGPALPVTCAQSEVVTVG